MQRNQRSTVAKQRKVDIYDYAKAHKQAAAIKAATKDRECELKLLNFRTLNYDGRMHGVTNVREWLVSYTGFGPAHNEWRKENALNGCRAAMVDILRHCEHTSLESVLEYQEKCCLGRESKLREMQKQRQQLDTAKTLLRTTVDFDAAYAIDVLQEEIERNLPMKTELERDHKRIQKAIGSLQRAIEKNKSLRHKQWRHRSHPSRRSSSRTMCSAS